MCMQYKKEKCAKILIFSELELYLLYLMGELLAVFIYCS